MEALKAEIERRKREREEAKAALTGGDGAKKPKYARRGDIEKAREGRLASKQEGENGADAGGTANDGSGNNEGNGNMQDGVQGRGGISEEEAMAKAELELNKKIPLKREEIIRRLRANKNPVTLFGETDYQRWERLQSVELTKHRDDTVGQRNFNIEESKREQEVKDDLSEEERYKKEEKAIMNSLEEVMKMPESNDYENVRKWVSKSVLEMRLAVHQESPVLKKTAMGRQKINLAKQTEEYMKPLQAQLKQKNIDSDLLAKLNKIVEFCKQREYKEAMDVYILVAIGNAAWPMGVTMVGIHARSAREKLHTDSVAHILNDESTRKYMQSFKRLMTFVQGMYPPADPTKLFT